MIYKQDFVCVILRMSLLRSIIKYCEYLKMKIPEITDFILNEYKIEVRDLLYGYICFEIYSE